MEADALLEVLRDAGALKDGHFLLASGRHSGQYVEKFDLLRRPAATVAACASIARPFAGQGVDVVAGPTTGGVILAFETARQMGVSAAYAERASDGSSRREFRRGTTFAPGSRVLVVDDILTTGGSVRETLAALAAQPVQVVGVSVLVDRSGGAVEFGVPLYPLVRLSIETWEAADCPLCRRGVPLVKPGTTATPAAGQ
ncbi:MAG: orotate phosphoribosyltransferase [Chloroflexota bacterium]